MFNITVVVFSLVIGALAHKLYLEKKMAKKRRKQRKLPIWKYKKVTRKKIGLRYQP